MDTWIASTFWLPWIMVPSTWRYKYLFTSPLSIPLGIHPEVKRLSHVVILFNFFFFFRNYHTVFHSILHSHRHLIGVLISPRPQQRLLFSVVSVCLYMVVDTLMEMTSVCDLTFISLMITGGEHLSMGTLSHCPPIDALSIANTHPFALDWAVWCWEAVQRSPASRA